MTLVYAKIIGMFVCGAESWGRGGGWGWEGVPGNFQNWVQHIDGCLWGLGVYLCTYVTYVHTYVHFCDKKFRSRSTYFEKICGSPLQKQIMD